MRRLWKHRASWCTSTLDKLTRSCPVHSYMNDADRLTANSCTLTFAYQKRNCYFCVPFTGFAVEAENDTHFRSLLNSHMVSGSNT